MKNLLRKKIEEEQLEERLRANIEQRKESYLLEKATEEEAFRNFKQESPVGVVGQILIQALRLLLQRKKVWVVQPRLVFNSV